jgi:replicative DNA helicase
LQTLPFYVDETGGLSIAQLCARARRLKRQRGLDVIVIDYIQLLQGSQRKASESRVQEVTEITTGLKALAKELNVPCRRAVAALAPGREPRRQAPAAVGPA